MFVNDFNQMIKADYVAVEVSRDDLKSLIAEVIASATRVAPQGITVLIVEAAAYGKSSFIFDAKAHIGGDYEERVRQFVDSEPDFTQWMLNSIFGEGSYIANKPNSLALASQDVFVYIPFSIYISKTFGL